MEPATTHNAPFPDFALAGIVIITNAMLFGLLIRVAARQGAWSTAAMWLVTAIGTMLCLGALMGLTGIFPIGIRVSGDPQGAMGAGLAFLVLNGGAALITGMAMATLALLIGRGRRTATGGQP